MVHRALAQASLVLAASAVDVDLTTVTYGKYYSLKRGQKSTVDNSYYMYRPKGWDASAHGSLPIIIEIHGGGFTGGTPQQRVNQNIQAAVDNGIAYISVGYRLVATKYYYGDGDVEELIHVDADGRLALDASGLTMDAYQVRRGRQEFNTKCSYDTTQMMEHLIAHAEEFGVDVHRISTTGGSAGGSEIHYLTWVYHQWNVDRYTPRGMVYTMAQLDYPVQNMLDRTWSLWTDDVGENTKLSTILAKSDCGMIVGNPWCDASSTADYTLCNGTYNDEVMGKFCGSDFDSATLGEVRDACRWPAEDPEVGKGMEVLWYNSLNMQKHQPKPFYLYIANQLNSTAGMNVVHNALYSRNYAKYAEMAGINYTVYYTDYEAMVEDDRGEQRFQVGQSVLNYRSSHDWVNQPGVRDSGITSRTETLLYHCLALGVQCADLTGGQEITV